MIGLAPFERQHFASGVMFSQTEDRTFGRNPKLRQRIAPLRQIVMIIDKHIAMLNAKRRCVRVIDGSHSTHSHRQGATRTPAPSVKLAAEAEGAGYVPSWGQCKQFELRKLPLTNGLRGFAGFVFGQSSEGLMA